MIDRLSNIYANLQIKFLAMFRPTVLFDKINQLDWYKGVLNQWVDDQNISSKSKVLEVGCAAGALTAYIAKSGCTVTGVDLDSEMIELANIKNADIDYVVADVLGLPIESNNFDAVIATSLINIIDEKNKAVNELVRVCKKGGKISILVPLENFNDDDLISLQSTIENTGFSAAAMRIWHKNAPKMNIEDLADLFLNAGLTKVSFKKYLQGMVISVSAMKSL